MTNVIASVTPWYTALGAPAFLPMLVLVIVGEWVIWARFARRPPGQCFWVSLLGHAAAVVVGALWLLLVGPMVDPQGLADSTFIFYEGGSARSFSRGVALLGAAEAPLAFAARYAVATLFWRPDVPRVARMRGAAVTTCLTLVATSVGAILLATTGS